jgi:aryl-alcohol dehydrogenase-like predicted oxidoreductase
MQSLYLQQLERPVSRIGLGSASFKHERRAMAFALLDAYHRLGGNVIDTAATYNEGEAEMVIGGWLAARGARSEIVLMDKGCRDDGELTPKGIRQAIGDSLRRFHTGCLDLWVVHRDHPTVPVPPVVDTLNEEIERGRIRAFGLSNWPRPRLAAAIEYAEKRGLRGPAVSSPHLCLAVPMEPLWANCLHATEDDIAWHATAGLALFAWSPLGHGFFSDHSGPFEESGEWVRRSYHNRENLERRARAEQLAKEKGVTVAQIALAYVLNLPAPTVALVGALTVQEVESAAVAADMPLSHTELDWLTLKADSR